MMPVQDRLRAMRPNRCAPCADYHFASPDEAGVQDRTFNRLNGANREFFVEVEIDRADPCLCIGRDLLFDCGWALELLLKGRVQPPLVAMTDERRASHLDPIGECSSRGADFEPTPAGASPDLEQDGSVGALFPQPYVVGNRLVPATWGDGRTLAKRLRFPLPPGFRLRLLAASPPPGKGRNKGAG